MPLLAVRIGGDAFYINKSLAVDGSSLGRLIDWR
jgi:hypothetical protein